MNIVLDTNKLFWRVNIGYLYVLDSLKNFITKCDRYYYKTRRLFCCKIRQMFIAKCGRSFYYKIRQFYYKMWQLLQKASILIQTETVITKFNVYYKMRQYRLFLTRDSSGASLPWAETRIFSYRNWFWKLIFFIKL